MAIWRHVILICFIVLAYYGSAQAQQSPVNLRCGSVSKVATVLKDKFGQHERHMGVTVGGQVIRVYIADESWTMTVRSPKHPDFECFLARGNEWEAVPEG